MAAKLEQVAYATVAKYESRTATLTFDRPTRPGALVVVVVSAAGALPVGLPTPAGFTRITGGGLRDIETAVFYRQNAPAMTQISAGFNPLTPRSIQVRAMEYSGVHQSNALDKVVIRQGESSVPYAGPVTPSQADSLCLGFVINQYDTAAYGFSGNLARLFESLSPQRWARGTNVDWERSRLNIFQAIPTALASFSLLARLAVARRWVCIIVCFRGGNTGPVKMTSADPDDPAVTVGGTGSLTVFGRLVSADNAVTVTGGPSRISPFNYQYRLGGWSGLLIGSGTEYRVEGTDGLYGWQVRSSDDDLPRGDGSLRGVDLASARQTVFRMNVGRGREDTERNLATLYRALVPRRDQDWELLWRRPTEPLKMMRVRPVDINRETSAAQLLMSEQTFALRAADPRHYAAVPTRVQIPVTPGLGDPTITQVFNAGNAPAYPVITITGPTTGPAVTRVELVNQTALTTFGVSLTLPARSVLVGDMEARITGAPRSVLTLDSQSKYGAWNLPRDPFRIEPDPTGRGGYNEIWLRTEPAGAPIVCELTFRSTWSG